MPSKSAEVQKKSVTTLHQLWAKSKQSPPINDRSACDKSVLRESDECSNKENVGYHPVKNTQFSNGTLLTEVTAKVNDLDIATASLRERLAKCTISLGTSDTAESCSPSPLSEIKSGNEVPGNAGSCIPSKTENGAPSETLCTSGHYEQCEMAAVAKVEVPSQNDSQSANVESNLQAVVTSVCSIELAAALNSQPTMTLPSRPISQSALPSRPTSQPALPSRPTSQSALPSRPASQSALPSRPTSQPALPSRPTSPPTMPTDNDDDSATVPVGDYPLICFDLETTGLSAGDEIVQIAACGIIDGVQEEFNQYVYPNKKMAFGASKVTGIRIKRGQVYHNRQKVETCSLLQALNRFLHWLKRFPKSVLVAHNAPFDTRMLLKGCVKHNLVQFGLKKAVAGFIDTVPVMKEIFPGKKSYQLENLVKDVLGLRFKAHDARDDTDVLLKLIGHKSVDRSILFKHSFTVNYAEDNYLHFVEKKKNMKSLQELVDSSVLSKGMAEKVASSGLTMDDLVSAVKRDGLDGIKDILHGGSDDKPRVTNRSAVIQQLFDHLSAKNVDKK